MSRCGLLVVFLGLAIGCDSAYKDAYDKAMRTIEELERKAAQAKAAAEKAEEELEKVKEQLEKAKQDLNNEQRALERIYKED